MIKVSARRLSEFRLTEPPSVVKLSNPPLGGVGSIGGGHGVEPPMGRWVGYRGVGNRGRQQGSATGGSIGGGICTHHGAYHWCVPWGWPWWCPVTVADLDFEKVLMVCVAKIVKFEKTLSQLGSLTLKPKI